MSRRQLESRFQADLIKDINAEFPGCVILINDANYLQGIPDLLILHGPYWAMLEAKAHENAPRQPNQEYYVDMLDDMSYAAFVYPENRQDILNDLRKTFRTRR